MKALWVIAVVVLAGCAVPEEEPTDPEVAVCGPACLPQCTVEAFEEGLVERTVTTCVRNTTVEGIVVPVAPLLEDCDAGYDHANDKCFDACPDGWWYSPTAGSCVQEVCGEDATPCIDPAQNPPGFEIQWIERSETVCERRPIASVASPLLGDGYYRVCASHNGTGILLTDTETCGIPLAGEPGDNTTAQFCFAFTWTARGGGLHLDGSTSFTGAHSDSHDPENSGDVDTASGECPWESDPVDGGYAEVDAGDCLQWESHHAWHYYPGKATGIHAGSTVTRGTTAQGEALTVQANGQVSWAIV